MRHIGILGHSADGAALCFLEMVRESARLLEPHSHPDIMLAISSMGPTLAAYERGDLAFVNSHLRHTVNQLARAGCDFFVCPDNTAHIALDAATEPYSLPGLHIADIVAQQAKADGFRSVALLGTKWTMEGPSYPRAFERVGIGLKTPGPDARALIDAVIFDELTQGVLSDSSRTAFLSITSDLKKVGCDAVALSCTEIPLLVTPDVSPLPTLDSTRLLAHAAVAVAIGKRPMPSWRGGSSM